MGAGTRYWPYRSFANVRSWELLPQSSPGSDPPCCPVLLFWKWRTQVTLHLAGSELHAVASSYLWSVDLAETEVCVESGVTTIGEHRLVSGDWSATVAEASQDRVFDKHYELGRLVGRGSYGDVRRGECRTTGALWAVKIVEKRAGPAKAFSREVEVMRGLGLDHPGLVKCIEVFEEKNRVLMVMEFLHGGDLFHVIAADNTFSEANAVAVVRAILEAVAFLHQRGIVHRDIKPENILCSSKDVNEMSVKLADFGFANFLKDNALLTTVAGTPFFIAPEILSREGHGPPADIYSTGVLAYTILSGKLPFTKGGTRSSTHELDFPESEWAGFSKEARNFITQTVRQDPDGRPSATEALQHPWFAPRTPKKGDSDAMCLEDLDENKSRDFDRSLLLELTSSRLT